MKPIVLVCCRVGDPYWVPSPRPVRVTCCRCGHDCLTHSARLHKQFGIPVWCVNCFAARRHPQDVLIQLPDSKPFDAGAN